MKDILLPRIAALVETILPSADFPLQRAIVRSFFSDTAIEGNDVQELFRRLEERSQAHFAHSFERSTRQERELILDEILKESAVDSFLWKFRDASLYHFLSPPSKGLNKDYRNWAGILSVKPIPEIRPLRVSAATPKTSLLNSRVVLITGGSAGIGRSLIDLALNQGAFVSAISRRPVAGISESCQPRFLAFSGDVRNKKACRNWVTAVMNWQNRIDALINNAAIDDWAVHKSQEILPSAALKNIFRVNLFSIHELLSLIIPNMTKAGYGRIVNMTSNMSMTGKHGFMAYGASKAALNIFTQWWSFHLKGTGVFVNAVHPGLIRTEMNPKGIHQPEVVWPMILSLITCDKDGPTGRFFTHSGELRWYTDNIEPR